MIRDNSGDARTQVEKLNYEIQANVDEPRTFTERIDRLIICFEKTNECKQAHNRLEEFYEKIRMYLPGEKQDLIMKIDDCYTELLIMYEEYFYKCGYRDGKKHIGLTRKLLQMFKFK